MSTTTVDNDLVSFRVETDNGASNSNTDIGGLTVVHSSLHDIIEDIVTRSDFIDTFEVLSSRDTWSITNRDDDIGETSGILGLQRNHSFSSTVQDFLSFFTSRFLVSVTAVSKETLKDEVIISTDDGK